jgi:hypothetical protein
MFLAFFCLSILSTNSTNVTFIYLTSTLFKTLLYMFRARVQPTISLYISTVLWICLYLSSARVFNPRDTDSVHLQSTCLCRCYKNFTLPHAQPQYLHLSTKQFSMRNLYAFRGHLINRCDQNIYINLQSIMGSAIWSANLE